jgi:putative GTP pyrophosphokinase
VSPQSKRHRIVEEIANSWKIEEPLYQELERVVSDYLKQHISETETLPVISHRLKTVSSMAKTALRKGKTYSELHDKLGFRIVCHFKSDLQVVRDFITKSFDVRHYEAKAERLKFDQLGYVSDHYEVSIDANKPEFEAHKNLAQYIFEIQVRTICQHAWADVEHELAYKQEIELDDKTKRKVFRLTSLLEICDDEFDEVNNHLLSLPQSRVFSIIKALEGKFYKLAKRDFDRDWAYVNVELLLRTIKSEQEQAGITRLIEKFLSQNEERITRIFEERRHELERNIFLSQPEIMLIWFLLETRMYDLISVWQQHYELDDLMDLSTWWGKPIPADY